MSGALAIESCAAEPIVTADDREHPTLALLRWSPAVSLDWSLQIYLNGELYDIVSAWGSDRALLRIDRGQQAIIELVAVDALDPWQERGTASGFVDPPICGVRVELPRDAGALDPTLRLGLRVEGEMQSLTPIWPSHAARPGFGLRFGEEDFGHSFTVGPGFGATEAGAGPFGCGGTRFRQRLDLAPGATSTVEAVLVDQAGTIGPVVSETEIETYAVTPAAGPVEPAGGFTLTWTLPTV